MSAPRHLAEVIRVGAQATAHRLAISSETTQLTYRQLDDRSSQGAQLLMSMGVARGDRVAFLSRNRSEYQELMFAVAKLGAVTVPLNWRLAPSEVATVVADAQPRVLIAENDLVDLVAGCDDHLLGEGLLLLDASDDPTRHWSTRCDEHPPIDPHVPVDADDVMWQLYTSGTTGQPKGVMLMHRNLFDMAAGLCDAWHFDLGSVVYVPYPSFHAVGTAWPVLTLYRAGTVILRNGFDATEFITSVENFGVTLAMMVPAVLQMVLAEPGVEAADLSSLRHIVYGAAPISQTVLNRAISVLPACGFHHAYGLTEATGTVTTMQWEEHRPGTERMKSCGRPLDWVEMRVVDPGTGLDQASGEVGEVWMRGPSVMKGYFRRPDETAEAITDTGWLRTGDAGYVDDEGYLYLTDRVKDMIISGGENIYPAEVENVLFACPGIREVAVVGVPDERWGEAVLAIAVPHPDVELDPGEVIAFCREHLAHYKCPREVVIRSEPLPLNPTGKVLRRELREPYWTGYDARIS